MLPLSKVQCSTWTLSPSLLGPRNLAPHHSVSWHHPSYYLWIPPSSPSAVMFCYLLSFKNPFLNYAEFFKIPISDDSIVYDSIYITLASNKTTETEDKVVGATGEGPWGGGGVAQGASW